MKYIITLLVLLSIAVGFSGMLFAYFPMIVVAAAMVGGWIAFTAKGGPSGPWPGNDVRPESSESDYLSPDDY